MNSKSSAEKSNEDSSNSSNFNQQPLEGEESTGEKNEVKKLKEDHVNLKKGMCWKW